MALGDFETKDLMDDFSWLRPGTVVIANLPPDQGGTQLARVEWVGREKGKAYLRASGSVLTVPLTGNIVQPLPGIQESQDEDDCEAKDLDNDYAWIKVGARIIAPSVQYADFIPGKVTKVYREQYGRSYAFVQFEGKTGYGSGAVVELERLRPMVQEGLEDDDFDLKSLDAEKPVESRQEWAKQNLYWDQERGMWEIPDTGYSSAEPGTVSHANHLFLHRLMPWLEQEGNELNLRLFMKPEHLDWMPLWNPFKDYVKSMASFNVLDQDTMDEIVEKSFRYYWGQHYALAFADALLDRFGDQVRSADPQKDFQLFAISNKGYEFFSQAASAADEYWDTDGRTPTIGVERVVNTLTWPQVQAAVYPQRDQLGLDLGDQRPPSSQLDMFEAAEGEPDEDSNMLKDMSDTTPVQVKEWLEENLVWEPYLELWELAGYSDYSGSLVDRANGEYWQKHYSFVSKGYGAHGAEWLGIKEEDIAHIEPEEFERLKKDWEGLSNYPLLDEEIHSALESEWRRKAWEYWLSREVRDLLVTEFPGYEEALLDFVGTDRAFAMFEEARDLAGEEWSEESGGDQTVNYESVVEHIGEDMLRRWMFPEEAEAQPELPLEEAYQYSCVMAPAPEDLASAVRSWSHMHVTDDELYLGEKGDKGREDEPHVTVLFGLHSASPDPEVLRLVEETQPLEIQVGTASLFEDSADYDVLKFDVESEGLTALNAKFREMPHTNTRAGYHPHLTVAYVQKGTCRELVGKPLIEAAEPSQLRFLVKSLIFSGKGEAKRKWRLTLGQSKAEDFQED
jgi:hypothetical protein